MSLTTEQEEKLAECETVIERGLSSSPAETGAALRTIRDEKLYRSYANFEAYCEECWDMSLSRAYQYIDYTSVCENLSTIVEKKPAVESQARPLASLTPERQREAWLEAIATAPNGKVTAAHVASVAERYREPAPVPPDEPWDLFEEMSKVHDVLVRIAEGWSQDHVAQLGAKLMSVGKELMDTGRVCR